MIWLAVKSPAAIRVSDGPRLELDLPLWEDEGGSCDVVSFRPLLPIDVCPNSESPPGVTSSVLLLNILKLLHSIRIALNNQISGYICGTE